MHHLARPRCWTYETAILVNRRLPNTLPASDYREYYAPDYSLNVAAHKVMDDCNKPQVGPGCVWARVSEEGGQS